MGPTLKNIELDLWLENKCQAGRQFLPRMALSPPRLPRPEGTRILVGGLDHSRAGLLGGPRPRSARLPCHAAPAAGGNRDLDRAFVVQSPLERRLVTLATLDGIARGDSVLRPYRKYATRELHLGSFGAALRNRSAGRAPHLCLLPARPASSAPSASHDLRDARQDPGCDRRATSA